MRRKLSLTLTPCVGVLHDIGIGSHGFVSRNPMNRREKLQTEWCLETLNQLRNTFEALTGIRVIG